MQFKQITSTKYVGEDGFTLIRCKSGSFSICKDSTVTRWGTGFQTVKSAENFMNTRKYIQSATVDTLPIEKQDLDFIETVYGMTVSNRGMKYTSDSFTLLIPKDFNESHEVVLKANCKDDVEDIIKDVWELVLQLDTISHKTIAASVYRGPELREVVAKSNRRSAKEIVKDLIRVKSSNVWAYGVEIKDNNATVGDVYIQFKGDKGGPADVYRYYDVPIKLWRKFISYPSKGAFVWKYLRNNFLYSKLTGNKRGVLKNAVN